MLTSEQREALPGWVPSSGLNLGLDLQGGSYLLLEVDVPAMREKRLANMVEDTRMILSEASVPVTGVVRNDQGVVVTVANPAQMDAALTAMRALIGGNPNGVADRTVQRQGNDRIAYAFTDTAMNSMAADAVSQSIEVVRRRLDSSGTKEISITRQGADRIVVQAPGESDPAELERLVGQTAQLTFQMVDTENSLAEAAAGAIPPDSELLPSAEPGGPAAYLVKRRVLVSGENLTRAMVGEDQNRQVAIDFRFDAQARGGSVRPRPSTSASPSPSFWTGGSFLRRRSRAPLPAVRARLPATTPSRRRPNS